MSVLIHIERLRCQAIVGIFPHERTTPQALELEVNLGVAPDDFWACALTGELSRSINYADVRSVALFLAQQGRFRLLESLVATLARLTLSSPSLTGPLISGARPLSVEIKASKPEVFGDGSAPSVSLRLTRAELEESAQLNTFESPQPSVALKRALRHLNAALITNLPELRLCVVSLAEGQEVGELRLSPCDALLPLTEGWRLGGFDGRALTPLEPFAPYDPSEQLASRGAAHLSVSCEGGLALWLARR